MVRGRRRRRSSRGLTLRRRAFRVLILAVLVWAAFAGYVLLRAAVDAQAGYSRLRTLRDAVGADRSVDVTAKAAFKAARIHFDRAVDRAKSPVLAPVRIVPVVERQLEAFEALAVAAAKVSDAGVVTMDEVGRLLDKPPTGAAGRAKFARSVSTVAARAERRLRGVDPGPSSWLISPLANRHAEFTAELGATRSTLAKARAAGTGLGRFLDGPRQYLVLAANNAEMRAGSGMFLSAGVMTVRSGGITLSPMEPTALMHVPKGEVKVGGDIRELWGWANPTREWRNLAMSPRFDANAPLAAAMWKALGKGEVDGVMAVDPIALRAILRATGPVDVEGASVDAEDAVQEILHDQYVGVAATEAAKALRRDRLSRIATATVGALDRGEWDARTVAREISSAVAGRHLLAWSSDPKEQAMWRDAGVAGTISRDDLMVSVLNRSGTKLDQFLRVTADLRRDGDEVVLRVTLRNVAPKGEPTYISGPHPLSKLKEGEYGGILTVTLPGTSRNARIEGIERLAIAGTDGRNAVVGTQVALRRGASTSFTVRFELPGDPSVQVVPSGRIPPINWRSGDDRWDDTSGHRVDL